MKPWVVITGAAGGIGQATAALFRERGYRVAGLDCSKMPHNLDLALDTDLTDLAEIKRNSEKIKDEGITLAGLINNAAFQVETSIAETREQDWDRMLTINLKAPFFLAQYLLPSMAERAAIVNVSSVHARSTSPGLAAYAASKGGLSALTRAMALEWGPRGIRVNSVLPGAIDTPMLDRGLKRASDPDEARRQLIKASPIGRIGEPRDVAELIYFLTDNGMAANITGQEFVCDSGVLSRLPSE